jgi:hypothetical protein
MPTSLQEYLVVPAQPPTTLPHRQETMPLEPAAPPHVATLSHVTSDPQAGRAATLAAPSSACPQ